MTTKTRNSQTLHTSTQIRLSGDWEQALGDYIETSTNFAVQQ